MTLHHPLDRGWVALNHCSLDAHLLSPVCVDLSSSNVIRPILDLTRPR